MQNYAIMAPEEAVGSCECIEVGVKQFQTFWKKFFFRFSNSIFTAIWLPPVSLKLSACRWLIMAFIESRWNHLACNKTFCSLRNSHFPSGVSDFRDALDKPSEKRKYFEEENLLLHTFDSSQLQFRSIAIYDLFAWLFRSYSQCRHCPSFGFDFHFCGNQRRT